MIKYFFSSYSLFTYRFPYCLYKWPRIIWNMLCDLCHWIHYGYPVCFTWSANDSIAKFALPLVKHLRDKNFGTPSYLVKEENKEGYETANKEWLEILDKIIYALDSVVYDRAMEARIKAYKSLQSSPTQKEIEEIEKKTQEGLELFGKHFCSLWW